MHIRALSKKQQNYFESCASGTDIFIYCNMCCWIFIVKIIWTIKYYVFSYTRWRSYTLVYQRSICRVSRISKYPFQRVLNEKLVKSKELLFSKLVKNCCTNPKTSRWHRSISNNNSLMFLAVRTKYKIVLFVWNLLRHTLLKSGETNIDFIIINEQNYFWKHSFSASMVSTTFKNCTNQNSFAKALWKGKKVLQS